jgi:tetratricopeptide (TPR) repeat protein
MKTWISVSLIAVLGIIAYSNSFHVPFVFDDEDSITGNPVIRDMGNFLLNGTGYSYNPRRFVGYLTFALNYEWGGLDVTGYHIVNLAIHIINALLVYGLMVLTFKTPMMKGSALAPRSGILAFFTAALFTVHPVQTEAVTYVVQRLASLAALFYSASLCLYIRFRLIQESSEGPVWRGYVLYGLSLVSAVMAMKTKEIAFTLPLIVVVYELIFFGVGDMRRRVLWALPLLATAAIIPLSMLNLGKPLGEVLSDVSQVTVLQSSLSRWEYLMTEFRVIVTYIRLLFLPVGQNLDYDYTVYQSLFDPQVAVSFLFLLGLFVLAIVLLRRAHRGGDASLRIISFGIVWFLITLSVESSIIPIVDVIFEHRLYLPSVGFFMSVVTAVFLLMRNKAVKGAPAAAALLAVVVVAMTGTTYARNIVWQSGISLWEDVVSKSPMKARPHNNLGPIYFDKGEYDHAIEQYEMALKLDPDYDLPHNNLGNAYRMKGWTDKAIEQYEIALNLNPQFIDAHNNLGLALLGAGHREEGIKEINTAYAIKHYNSGKDYLRWGFFEDAITEFQSALRLRPDYAETKKDIAIAESMLLNKTGTSR